MANLPNKFRGIVSGQRKRYKEDGFNLDLSYIKDNIIAMGFPAENVEAIYRNNREDVLKLLTEKHGNKYKVYNLCSERTYGATLFPHYAEYPFKDHNPPDIELIIKFCEDVHNYLCADSSHVVAIHCKAGKGRTGTMICCYLLYSNAFQTANEALTYYAEKRTKDKKGVTIPSQRRYVEYYEQLLRNRLTYHDVTLYILEVRISPVDVSIRSGSIKMKGATESVPLQEFQRTGDYSTVVLDRCMPLTGDVKVELCRSKLQEKRMHFWFNTFFVMRAAIYDSQERLVLTLDRMEIDDAHKGNTKKCPEQVQVFLKPVPPSGRYSENLEANRMLPALPQQPMIDSNPTYATPNNIAHLDYQQQQQQKHHMGLMKSTNHNQSLIPNANYSEGQQHHRTANNNRTSLGNSQQNSGIYCNINLNPTGLGDAIQQQQQQHGAAAASSQQQPQLRYHSAGSSEENSGTDSVGDEEGWESGNTSSRSTSFFTNLKLCRKIKQIFPNFTPGRPELMASTSMATGLQASGLQDDQRRQSMMQVCSSFLRRSLSSTAGSIRSKLQSVKSSSASYDFQTSSVSSASSQSVCRDQQSIGEITSSEEMLLPQSCVVGGTAENTYDSALTTSSPSHNEQESQATFDEQQLVAKISSLNEQQLQRTLGDELDSTLSQRSVVPDSGNETPTERVQNHAHSAVQHDQLITQLGEKFKEF